VSVAGLEGGRAERVRIARINIEITISASILRDGVSLTRRTRACLLSVPLSSYDFPQFVPQIVPQQQPAHPAAADRGRAGRFR
jgi:hypothetical protein